MAKKLGIYFTAGYPQIDSTGEILEALSEAEVDFIEIGVPFSDPLADGPVIQESSKKALENGISLKKIFEQVADFVQKHPKHPRLLFMGYLNTFLSYGMESALSQAASMGIEGFILPDLPQEYYQKHYKELFSKYGIKPVFFISPSTTEARMQEVVAEEQAFIYVLSRSATTGKDFSEKGIDLAYFERCKALQTSTERFLGFGISTRKDMENYEDYVDGFIIGSAFVKALGQSGDVKKEISSFMNQLK